MVDGVAAQVDGGDDAEKLAALEVVKRRLKAAGLGVLTLVCIRSDRPICNRSTVSAKLISLCNQSQQKLFHVQSEESNRFYAEAEIVVPENVTHRSTHYRRNLSRSSRTYALGCRSGYAQTSDFRSGGITV